MLEHLIRSPGMILVSALGLFSVILGIIKSIIDFFKNKKVPAKPMILIILGGFSLAVILTLASLTEEDKSSDVPSDTRPSGTNTTIENGGDNHGIIVGGDASITINGGDTPPTGSPVVVFDVTLSSESLELLVGDSASLLATVTYTDNTIDHAATWFSSDPAIAEVDENGSVTALSPGSVTITAQAGKNNTVQKAVCTVTVTEPARAPSGYSIRLSTQQAAIMLGTFYVYVEPYEEDVTDIVLYAVSPSGDTQSFKYDPNKNDCIIYTETGTWTIYASVTNSAGTYTAQKPEDYATLEILPLEGAAPVVSGVT